MGNRLKWKGLTASERANMKIERSRVRCHLLSQKISRIRLFCAYGSQISYRKPSILYTLPNLWIISQCSLFLCRLTLPFLILSVGVFLNPPPFVSFSPSLFCIPSHFLFHSIFHTSSSSSVLLGFMALSEGCKSMSCGRADGAALFKYLMELTGGADLIELGGELKVRFPKAATSTTQLGALRDRGD